MKVGSSGLLERPWREFNLSTDDNGCFWSLAKVFSKADKEAPEKQLESKLAPISAPPHLPTVSNSFNAHNWNEFKLWGANFTSLARLKAIANSFPFSAWKRRNCWIILSSLTR